MICHAPERLVHFLAYVSFLSTKQVKSCTLPLRTAPHRSAAHRTRTCPTSMVCRLTRLVHGVYTTLIEPSLLPAQREKQTNGPTHARTHARMEGPAKPAREHRQPFTRRTTAVCVWMRQEVAKLACVCCETRGSTPPQTRDHHTTTAPPPPPPSLSGSLSPSGSLGPSMELALTSCAQSMSTSLGTSSMLFPSPARMYTCAEERSSAWNLRSITSDNEREPRDAVRV